MTLNITYIVAPNEKIFLQYCVTYNLKPNQVVYIASPEHLQGLNEDSEIKVLVNAGDLKGAILREVQMARITKGVKVEYVNMALYS